MTEMTPETLSEALWASGHCRFCGQLRMHHPGCKGKKLVSAWEADRQRIEALEEVEEQRDEWRRQHADLARALMARDAHIEALEKDRDEWRRDAEEAVKAMGKTIDRQQARIEALEKALQFYAAPGHHPLRGHWNDDYPGGIGYEFNNYSVLDFGEIATAALAASELHPLVGEEET